MNSPVDPGASNLPASTRIQPNLPLGTGGSPPPSSEFQSLMQSLPAASPQKASEAQSPFDIFEGKQNTTPQETSLDSLLQQISSSRTTADDISTQFKDNPTLKLSQGQNQILRDKLSDSSAHFRSVNQTLGVNPGEQPEIPAGSKPIERFLSYVTDGQSQLDMAQQQLSDLQAKGENLNPSDFLLIQVKLSKAQRQLEYSSILLSKAVDDFKQLMSVQI